MLGRSNRGRISTDYVKYIVDNKTHLLFVDIAIFKGRLTRRQVSRSGDQNIYHLKIDAVIHSDNLPSAQKGSVLRVVTRLPLDTRHQPTIFTVRTENGRIVLDSYRPYSKEAEKELEQRCFK